MDDHRLMGFDRFRIQTLRIFDQRFINLSNEIGLRFDQIKSVGSGFKTIHLSIRIL